MIYNDASTMILTRNCLALATSEAVEPIGLLQSKVTYTNGAHSIVDLATGVVTFKPRYNRQSKPNKVNLDPKSYEVTPVYFDNPADPESTESLYRHGKVHILNAALSAYHRELFNAALQRAEVQCSDSSKIRIPTHHVNGYRRDNTLPNLLPVTETEHIDIHKALRHGASTYDSLVAGLGEELVVDIFGTDYFNFGDCSVFTASIGGVPYTQLMLSQISAANLPADTECLRVKCLNGKHTSINIAGLSIYGILSALYTKRAVEIII